MPLTNAVLHSMPADRSGVASALLNASREVAALLGITIIGAVLRARQGSALAHGTSPSGGFLDGYHAGLLLTIALVAAGAGLSYLALRRLPALPGTRPSRPSRRPWRRNWRAPASRPGCPGRAPRRGPAGWPGRPARGSPAGTAPCRR